MEQSSLRSIIDNFVFTQEIDSRKFNAAPDGKTYVEVMRNLIDSKLTITTTTPMIWVNMVTINVSIFVWRTCLDRIPTYTALSGRGRNILSHICSGKNKTSNHLFATCPFTQEVLDWIFKWFCIPFQMRSNVSDYINFVASWGHCSKKKKILLAIIYGSMWSIWMGRNDKTFKNIIFTLTKRQTL